MQYSIDRLFELIEQRFGSKVSNSLLGLVVAALAVFCANVVISQGVQPVSVFTHGLISSGALSPPLSWTDILSPVLAIIVVSGCLWALLRLFGNRFLRQDIIRIQADCREILDRIEQQAAKADEILAQAEELQKDLREDLPELTPGLPTAGKADSQPK